MSIGIIGDASRNPLASANLTSELGSLRVRTEGYLTNVLDEDVFEFAPWCKPGPGLKNPL